jgi:SAM-dependent methyltransferase
MSDGRFRVEAEFLTIGRTFAEYRWMFDLAAGDLNGRAVLDCGGGAGAFTAAAAELAGRAVAADPLYGPPAATLEPELSAAVETNVAQLREKRDLFVWDVYGDVETRGRYLRAATERFLADYAANPGRYVAAAVPSLPFVAGAFDLALVANLLFLYDDRLDLAFHLAAVRELVRVAGEVRVFPLSSLDATRSVLVDPFVDRLRADGLSARFESVPYEFQPGATEMLVVTA